MKILNLCGYTWSIGGPAKIIYDHAEIQLNQGHEVSVLTPIWPNDELYPAPKGMKVVAVKKHWFSKFFPEFSLEALQWLKQNHQNYDVIHVHGPFHFLGMLPWFIGFKGVKAITVHGLLDKWAINHGYWKKKIVSFFIQKSIFKRADIIQINNEDERQDLINYLGYTHQNVRLIPNGMKVENFLNQKKEGTFKTNLGIENNQKVFLFLSRLNIKKGLDILLQAWKVLKNENKSDNSVLILAGPDDGYLAYCQAFIIQNDLSKSIKTIGMLTGEPKTEALNQSDFFVLPSYSEGFSIAVLEAMASKLPVIVSDRVGFGPQIIEARAGYITTLEVESIKKALLFMRDNPSDSKVLADNAFELLNEKYTIEIVANQLINAFFEAKNKT